MQNANNDLMKKNKKKILHLPPMGKFIPGSVVNVPRDMTEQEAVKVYNKIAEYFSKTVLYSGEQHVGKRRR